MSHHLGLSHAGLLVLLQVTRGPSDHVLHLQQQLRRRLQLQQLPRQQRGCRDSYKVQAYLPIAAAWLLQAYAAVSLVLQVRHTLPRLLLELLARLPIVG